MFEDFNVAALCFSSSLTLSLYWSEKCKCEIDDVFLDLPNFQECFTCQFLATLPKSEIMPHGIINLTDIFAESCLE